MRTLRLARRTATDGRAPDLPAEALEQEREFLLRSLDDLDRERAAGDMDEQDYRALRDGYTARAAAVLRALERAQNPTGVEASPDRVPAPAAPASSGARRSRFRLTFWANPPRKAPTSNTSPVSSRAGSRRGT